MSGLQCAAGLLCIITFLSHLLSSKAWLFPKADLGCVKWNWNAFFSNWFGTGFWRCIHENNLLSHGYKTIHTYYQHLEIKQVGHDLIFDLDHDAAIFVLFSDYMVYIFCCYSQFIWKEPGYTCKIAFQSSFGKTGSELWLQLGLVSCTIMHYRRLP